MNKGREIEMNRKKEGQHYTMSSIVYSERVNIIQCHPLYTRRGSTLYMYNVIHCILTMLVLTDCIPNRPVEGGVTGPEVN